jgi:medium-chain acyl-[acyl-carrier-protein] hydrolase
MIYTMDCLIRIDDCSYEDKASDKGLLSIFEEIASRHSTEAGIGPHEIITEKRAWVILNWHMQVKRRPSYTEKLKVSTWAIRMDRFFADRGACMRDQDGEIIAIAYSRWILTDVEKRRPIRFNPDEVSKYKPEYGLIPSFDMDLGLLDRGGCDAAFGDDSISDDKLKAMAEAPILNSYSIAKDFQVASDAVVSEYKIARADVDMVGHLHNIDYLKIALETIDEESYMTRTYNDYNIIFEKEIRKGDQLKLCTWHSPCQGRDKIEVAFLVDNRVRALVELME